jgi:hypothetical protein
MICVFLFYPVEPQPYIGRLCGAVCLASWAVLLLISLILLFGNWRAGLLGLLLLFAELFIAGLFPEL